MRASRLAARHDTAVGAILRFTVTATVAGFLRLGPPATINIAIKRNDDGLLFSVAKQ